MTTVTANPHRAGVGSNDSRPLTAAEERQWDLLIRLQRQMEEMHPRLGDNNPRSFAAGIVTYADLQDLIEILMTHLDRSFKGEL